MYTIALAALLAAAPTALPDVRMATMPGATRTVAVDETAEQLIESARSAQARGDLEGAYRDFARALRRKRADGVLAIDASYGVAHVLVMQSRFRDAADALEQLAADANLLGDANTEAHVLLDVVSLKVSHHRKAAARPDALRLKELITDVRVSSDTRRLIKARLS
ncbi:hypothetical protein [Gemmatimonas sp.]